MKYHCSWCDYIYDELKWDIEEGIEEKTYFENLPNDFFCPFCDTYKDDFVLLPEEINYLDEIKKLWNFDLEHYPKMDISWDKLFFEIWMLDHPNDQDHFIYKVELYDESDLIDKKIYKDWDEFKWEFDLEYIDKFEIRVYCSRDGIFSTWLITR